MAIETLRLPHRNQMILAVPASLMVEHSPNGEPLPRSKDHVPTVRPKIVDNRISASVREHNNEESELLLRDMGQLVLSNQVEVQ